MLVALLLTVLVAAYNNVVNRWEPFHHGAYVPVNLTFVGALAFIIVGVIGIPSERLGSGTDVRWIAVAAAIVFVFATGAQAVARSRFGHRIADRRVADLSGGELVYHVLVRIPLGTAVTEEVVFRGLLFGLWRDAGVSVTGAALFASIAFGFWHVMPTIVGLRLNDPHASRSKVTLAVGGAVAITTLAGLALTWLRVEGGLLAPIVLHAGINSTGVLAAVAAGYRQSTGGSRSVT